ncbi:MAG TPA: TauD/TfdA family dioxygenase, partial [Acidimicrobiales bacterium]
MAVALHELEPAAEWRAGDIADADAWTLRLSSDDHAELDAALAVAKRKSADPLQLERDDFPLDRLATKLDEVVDTLLNGRGFARIATLDTARYDDDDLTLLYWGIGLHLGEPWAQNKHGHVLGDVTDQGKTIDDPTVRGNELGGVALDYHTDGSDLVGLLCLRTARSGGLSCVANAVAIHN